MAKVSYDLKHDAGLSEDEAEELAFGQAHWWLKCETDGEFVKLPKKIRGDVPLEVTLKLEPGQYTLGVGPVRSGVRFVFDVEADPDAEAAVAAAATGTPTGAIDVKGKTIVITGDLDCADRDAAKAWLVGLGAKVSSSISGKTNLLVVGTEPGAKKLEEATQRGIQQVTEAELVAAIGSPAGAAPALAKGSSAGTPPGGKELVAKLLAATAKEAPDAKKVEKLVGPAKFQDLGMVGTTLWGISVGPRGGLYWVQINLKNKGRFAFKCNCTGYGPCAHAYALLVTADRHFVPPAEPPDGHEDRCRYVSFME